MPLPLEQLTEPVSGGVSGPNDDIASPLSEPLMDSTLNAIDVDPEVSTLDDAGSTLEADIAAAERKGKIFRQKLAARKAKLQANPALYLAYRVVIGTLGTLILVGGIVMLATPGPGWLTIFLGLGILASEFSWAHRLNVWTKTKARAVLASAKTKMAQRKAKKSEPQKSAAARQSENSSPQESPEP
ncbi:MAG: TIGR02611 family protein [Propionibacteriaceae bacterium]|jgi:uncharacterized protein (TIGR02611 family)|nr:TIGR02611 family protein [Propionibacteriaceae bacterium]